MMKNIADITDVWKNILKIIVVLITTLFQENSNDNTTNVLGSGTKPTDPCLRIQNPGRARM